VVPEKQGLKLYLYKKRAGKSESLSSGSRKTRIETKIQVIVAWTSDSLSSGSRKTRIETGLLARLKK